MFALPLTAEAVLRPLEPWHAAEFLANIDRARAHILPWVGRGFVATDPESARAVLQRYADSHARDNGGIYGIWLDGRLVGGVMLVSFDTRSGTCEAGCWLEPEAEGRGLITRAVGVLIDWAFRERGMHRVEWHTLATNVRSIRVAERLGMRREAVLREADLRDGVRTDVEIWAILASEWPAR
jgi:RimJ/RimL family protein N-acetyltransferase